MDSLQSAAPNDYLNHTTVYSQYLVDCCDEVFLLSHATGNPLVHLPLKLQLKFRSIIGATINSAELRNGPCLNTLVDLFTRNLFLIGALDSTHQNNWRPLQRIHCGRVYPLAWHAQFLNNAHFNQLTRERDERITFLPSTRFSDTHYCEQPFLAWRKQFFLDTMSNSRHVPLTSARLSFV